MSLRAPLPRAAWVLGIVSLCMDYSSEMIHALLPLFLTVTLGAPVLLVGVLEGGAEALSLALKLVSGRISDLMARRKPLILLGYGLSALTKPLFALAGGPGLVVTARLADRVGKGIRGAPRDALLSDETPPAQRGAAFGLRQSLDTLGAVLGPLTAAGLMILFAGDIRLVFWAAVVPAAIAVAVLAFGLTEDARPRRAPAPSRPRFSLGLAIPMGRPFRAVLLLAFTLHLCRLPEAFLLLRASDSGLPPAALPLVLVAMNGIYAAAAYPAGLLSDRLGRRGLMALGLLALAGAQALLSVPAWPFFEGGLALWGLHLALTQGLISALVADTAPPGLAGTGFGQMNVASALGLLLAGAGGGLIWQQWDAQTAYLLGAGAALLTALQAWLLLAPSPAGDGR